MQPVGDGHASRLRAGTAERLDLALSGDGWLSTPEFNSSGSPSARFYTLTTLSLAILPFLLPTAARSESMPTPQTTSSVDSGDVNLFVRQFGLRTGRMPLLILHGANYYDSADWIDVGRQLGRDREVRAFDARGFGNSTWSPSKDYGLATVLDDVRAVIDHAGWQRAVIIGHSRGGSQALLAAARMPEIIAGLVLVDCNPGRGFGPPGARRCPPRCPWRSSRRSRPPSIARQDAGQIP